MSQAFEWRRGKVTSDHHRTLTSSRQDAIDVLSYTCITGA
jgi:hypothetical protein